MSSPRKLAANSCTSASSRGLLTGIAQWPCSPTITCLPFPTLLQQLHYAMATITVHSPRALDSGAHYSVRVKDKGRYKMGHLLCCSKEHKMNRFERTQRSDLLEEAVTILFCLVDDGYQNIN